MIVKVVFLIAVCSFALAASKEIVRDANADRSVDSDKPSITQDEKNDGKKTIEVDPLSMAPSSPLKFVVKHLEKIPIINPKKREIADGGKEKDARPCCG